MLPVESSSTSAHVINILGGQGHGHIGLFNGQAHHKQDMVTGTFTCAFGLLVGLFATTSDD